MPRFLELERAQRSVILGLWRASRRAPASGTSGARWSLFVTLAGGMGELVETLAARLPPEGVHLKERVSGIERQGTRWRIEAAGRGPLEADRVVVATEAHAASRLFRYVDPALAAMAETIAYASSATVSLGYRRSEVPHPLGGFGFVVPRVEGRDLLACTFSSVKYPGRAPDGFVLLRAFLGGALNASVLDAEDGELARRARQELGAALGIVAEPVLTRVARHPMAMPQYGVGHRRTVEALESRLAALPGLVLAGAAYRGVGLADCVRSGEEAAERALLGPPSAGGGPPTA
jgi:oxygen-dependent protoporphyrinogen oxidase